MVYLQMNTVKYGIDWEIMRNCEKLWEIMRNYEKLWEIVRNYEKLWQIMRNYEKLWEIIRNYEKLCENTRNYEKLWEFELFGKWQIGIWSLLNICYIQTHIWTLNSIVK